jgi:hypothetical protein
MFFEKFEIVFLLPLPTKNSLISFMCYKAENSYHQNYSSKIKLCPQRLWLDPIVTLCLGGIGGGVVGLLSKGKREK